MKSKEEIEQLAEQYIKDNTGDHYVYCGYIDGYTQCQEDMAKDIEYWQGEFDHLYKDMADKRYTEEDMLKAFEKGALYGSTKNGNTHYFEDLINSLNKQD